MVYKLTYFNARGAAEFIRHIFLVSKQEYQDNRVNKEDWPASKAKMPFGQMPVLEEDGKQLAQSIAIARYLSRKFGGFFLPILLEKMIAEKNYQIA